MAQVNWSERDGKYWVKDLKGENLLFDSVIDAANAARRIETERAVVGEVDRIVAWLCGDHGDWSAAARKFASAIESGEYK